MRPTVRTLLMALVLVLAITSGARAQQGTITGTVVDAEAQRPIPEAQVQVLGGGAPAGVLTDAGGRFRISVAPGSYSIVVTRIGFETRRVDGVSVAAGQARDVLVTMASQALVLNPVIVSVSKRAEKAVDAPATVAVVSETAVEERPVTSPVEHLKTVVGVDIISQGLQASNVVVRGFNNIFSGATHFLTDHRIAGIPSLRVNLMHFIPSTDEDVARMEVVLGPGSALYGPNTANGVVHLLTKSPLTEQKTTVSVAGGEQSVFKGTFRTSQLLGEDLGIKLSGSYFRGDEWEFVDPVEAAARAAIDENPAAYRAQLAALGVPADEIEARVARVGVRDFETERWSGEVRADWRVSDAGTLVAQVGRSDNTGIELTGIGAGQTDGWAYTYYQTRFNAGRFFAQTYLNTSDSHDVFLLRSGAPLVDQSRMWVSQLQHGTDIADGRLDLTYGLDYLLTTPDSRGTIHGQYEEDDEISEVGGYAQVLARLADQWELVTAMRLDKSSVLEDPVWSPRAALVFKPQEEHAFRATFNRAFSTPTTLNMFLDISGGRLPGGAGQLGYLVRAQGPGKEGISFTDASGGLAGMLSPFTPQAAGGPSQLLPVDVNTLWRFGVGLLQATGRIDAQTAGFLSMLDAGQGGVGINALDPITGGLTPLGEVTVPDVPRLKENTTTTIELGYQGIVDNRVALAADVWSSTIKNFTSPLIPWTPLLTLDRASLGAFLVANGLPPQTAGQIAAGLGGAPEANLPAVPLGVVSSPDVRPLGADLVTTYVNYGEVDLWGADVSAQAFLTDQWSLGLTASLVSDDHFTIEDIVGIERIVALNAPKRKGTASIVYRNLAAGFNGEVRMRHTEGFPANSADFIGTACLGVTGPLVQDCVEAATLFDLTLGYGIRNTGARLQLYVSNVFDSDYRSFVGVPDIGRLALLQLKYEF